MCYWLLSHIINDEATENRACGSQECLWFAAANLTLTQNRQESIYTPKFNNVDGAYWFLRPSMRLFVKNRAC